mmetsp:Transcript_38297/g.151488  ORF Transcript_38297/g.151488 Transcript_38297/m.151488 type:complete len:92 (+) Transcript_38297:1462-1737(+)
MSSVQDDLVEPSSGSSVIPDSGRPRRGPPNSNLFIFNIPPDWNDQILAEVFMPFGKVLSSKVYVDIETRKSKGFGEYGKKGAYRRINHFEA